MSFKRTRISLFFAMTVAIFSGCSMLRDEAPKAQLSDPTADAKCLSQMSSTLGDYFAGKSNATNITILCDCASRALDLFVQNVRGYEPGVYRSEDLRVFLNEYFLNPSAPLNASLFLEGMKLKRVALGGRTDTLTLQDIEDTKKLITILKKEMIRLMPYVPFSPAIVEKWDDAQLKVALDDLSKSARELGNFFGRQGPSQSIFYSFGDLNAFMGELASFFEKQNKGSGDHFGFLQKYLTLGSLLKGIFVSPGTSGLVSSDWEKLFSISTQVYGLFLRTSRYFNRLQKEESYTWKYGPGLVRIAELMTEFAQLIGKGVQVQVQHRGEGISYDQLNSLINEIGALKYFPIVIDEVEGKKITSDGLKTVLRPFFSKIFGDVNRRRTEATELSNGQVSSQTAVTFVTLQGFNEFLRRWYLNQLYLYTMFRDLGAKDQGLPGKSFKRSELLNAFDKGISKWSLSEEDRKGLRKDVREVISLFPPFFIGEEKEVGLKGAIANEKDPVFSFHNLSEMNWMRSVARLLMRGYAEIYDLASEDYRVTQKEFEDFYRYDFWVLGLELRLFDPRNRDVSASMRFREANLFTFASNGDNYVDLNEAHQLLAMLISASRHFRNIYEDLLVSCQDKILPGFDVLGRHLIELECYRDRVFLGRRPEHDGKYGMDVYFQDSMPGLANYFLSLNPNGSNPYFQNRFIEHLENGVRRGGYKNPGPVEACDTESYVGLLQYMEAIFARFDVNQDGYINQFEGAKMFPIFRGELKKIVAGQLPDSDLDDLFAYMLRYGSPPVKSILGGTKWIMWKYILKRKYAANRGILLQILSNVSSQGATGTHDRIMEQPETKR